jgi:ATP-dependent Clp protease ATP-binding subunit ClpC
MYDRFTDSAKRAIIDAQEQARTLRHGYIGSEHLLLGLLAEHPCPATHVLTALGISPEELRERLLTELEPGPQTEVGHMPFTPAAKKTLELALRCAVARSIDYVGTEHLLLGITREGSGPAGRVLADLGIEPEAVEPEVAALSEQPYWAASPGPLRGFLIDPGPE